MLLIDFACIQVSGLILRHSSGVRYTNQAGGMSCDHPEVEGVFVPIAPGLGADEFARRMCNMLCWSNGVNERTAAELDDEFAHAGLPFKVDRDHLQEVTEAWIPVVVGQIMETVNGYQLPKSMAYGPLEQCEGMRGIYVHPNCD